MGLANVLVVDDSASMRMMIKVTLKDAGFNVIEAKEANAGLKKVLTSQFDVVITDINISGMNGYDFIKKIRSIPAYQHTPIITITAEKGKKEKAKGKDAGATEWIVKPFSPARLVEVMKKVLSDVGAT